MTEIILSAIALILILVGIWHEEKLIAFEDMLLDRIAYGCAHLVAWYRNKKSGREVWHVRRR
ncbi:MAG: hypothetical protein J6B99_09655 [Oscillospiraceae bacterium]|nr:hypothetical protein [Oscillospiraceae bacterium]